MSRSVATVVPVTNTNADRLTEAQFADTVRELIIINFSRVLQNDPSYWDARRKAITHGEETAALFVFFIEFYQHLSEWEGCHDDNHRFFRILSDEAFAVTLALYEELDRGEFSDAWSLWAY